MNSEFTHVEELHFKNKNRWGLRKNDNQLLCREPQFDIIVLNIDSLTFIYFI